MSEMENDIRAFFVKIINSIAVFLLWAIVNYTIGIFLGWGLYAETPTWKNWLFYLFAIATLALVILYLVKKWKGATGPR